METPLAKPPDNFPLNSSSLIIIPNGCCINNNKDDNKCSSDDDDDDDSVGEYQVFDIEMISIESCSSYTSLKDLLTTSSSSSPKNSWKEIPIKDPLLQHAAWAYLQPMASPDGAHAPTFFQKFKDNCSAIIACFNDVVLVMFKGWFVDDDDQEQQQQHHQVFD